MRLQNFIAFLTVLSVPAEAAEMDVLAGTGTSGYTGDGGPARAASLNQPFGVVVGPGGDIYFCDTGNHVVRKVSRKSGVISTVAGTGTAGYSGDGGPALEAELFEPYEVRFNAGGDLFWVEMKNHLVRRLDARSGIVSTVAGTGEKGFGGDGGPAPEARLDRPHTIQFGREGHLYICDIGNHRIRRVDLESGTIETFCGNGKKEMAPDGAKVGPETPLLGPRALDIDAKGDFWLALREGNRVYRIDMEKGVLHHVAGTGEMGFSGNGGPAVKATLSGPKGVALSPDGKMVYLADTESHSVRAIDLSGGDPVLRLVAGDGERGDGPDAGDPLNCRMDRLHGVGCDPVNGDLYIGDTNTHKVRVVRGLEASSRMRVEDFSIKEFDLEGVECFVRTPTTVAAGRPWIWRMRFPGAFNQADAELLARGWSVAYTDVAGLFGGPEAMRRFDRLYAHVTGEMKLAAKPVLEGMSRGGLPAMNWARANPARIAGIYLDAPVLDIRSWPKKWSPKLWEQCLAAYGLAESEAGPDYRGGPLEHLTPLAEAGIPILLVCGGADEAVPFVENGGILEKRYEGPIEVVVKATCGHHPHSLYDPAPIVRWVEKVAGR